MEIRKGIAVSPGIAIAKPMLIDSKDYRIPRRSVMASQRANEIQRLRKAFATAIKDLEGIESDKAFQTNR
jgi:phosphotransferase system enzyme I (PtsI)